uniref:ApeA N-terminal domain 1-containing protein n=1 Tax=Dietzia cinnamea TaxID=321318 RepID=UPI001C3F43CA
DNRLPGILTWEPTGGATLELLGGFSPPPEYQPDQDGSGFHTTRMIGDVRPGTIYGETPSGRKISIWDAQRGKYTVNGFGHQVREEFWSAQWVCIGDHIVSPDESKFANAEIVLDELYYMIDDPRLCPPKWANIEGVDNPRERLDNGTFLLPYVLPVIGGNRNECVAANTDDVCYALNTRATAPWISPATEAMPDLKLDLMTNRQRRGPVINLSVGASASIRRSDGAAGSASDFVDRMSPIIDLVRLATFDSCGVEKIALSTIDGENISLLTRIGEDAAPTAPHEPESVVFDFADVPLAKYLATRESLTTVHHADYAWNVIIGHCGYAPRFTEQYVSQVLAAAEGFHTWCLGNPEATLSVRLHALHESLPADVQKQLGLDVENWAKWSVWARNHVAHGGAKQKKSITDHSQLYAVAKTVHLVTYLAVLRQLDVPIAKIRDALLNHPRLSNFVPHCEVVNKIKPPENSTSDSA